MTTADLIARFEDCTFPADQFHHAEHVRVAWHYLREEALPVDALHRFVTNLRRFAAHNGSPGRYHETITWAYLALIHERILQDPDAEWAEFAETNADLLAWQPSILDRYYTSEVLFSDVARRIFVLPNLLSSRAESRDLVHRAPPAQIPRLRSG